MEQSLNIIHTNVYKMLSKKDILVINKQFHEGRISNEGSLDFALAQVYRSKSWLRAAAILTRALVLDHAFEDGNKRTAAAVIATIMELNKVHYSPERIDKTVLDIAKKNINSIRELERVIKDVRE